jgi:hypothetical protein
MHKCDCKNADCNRFDGTCTCWEEYTGINCEEKILNKTRSSKKLNETSSEGIDFSEKPQSHMSSFFKKFVILLGFIAIFYLLSEQGKGKMNQKEAPVCQMYMPQYMDERFSVKPNPYKENDTWVVQFENTDPLRKPDLIIETYEL